MSYVFGRGNTIFAFPGNSNELDCVALPRKNDGVVATARRSGIVVVENLRFTFLAEQSVRKQTFCKVTAL
jgi:hypothetical protein